MKLYQYVSHFFLKKLNISNCLDFFLGAAFTSTFFFFLFGSCSRSSSSNESSYFRLKETRSFWYMSYRYNQVYKTWTIWVRWYNFNYLLTFCGNFSTDNPPPLSKQKFETLQITSPFKTEKNVWRGGVIWSESPWFSFWYKSQYNRFMSDLV